MWELVATHFLTVFGIVLGIVLIARILNQGNRPSVSFAWMMAIIFVPYIGVPAYFLFGGRKVHVLSEEASVERTFQDIPIDQHPSLLASVVDNVLTASAMSPARDQVRVEFLPDGDATYLRLMELIEEAERTIHIVTYILGRDDVGRAIVDALTRRAQEGVEVRLLLDSWGCLRTKRKFVQPLRDAGGFVGTFMPFLPVARRWSANLRNHRKILIIDGHTALTGGMNLATEYMGPTPNPDRWIDTAVVVHGNCAADLDDVFLADWRFATGERVLFRSEDKAAAAKPAGDAVAQVVASGPNVNGDPLYEAILTAAYEVQQRLWIVTPYFVPDEGLMRALRLQAKLGRDVRLVLPTKSNHIFPDIARGRFVRELREVGARVYGYSGRMMHAKHLVFDSRIAVVGSINFDMRSLYLNYEAALFVYTAPEVNEAARWMERLMHESEDLKAAQAGPVRRLAEDVTMLVSPLL